MNKMQTFEQFLAGVAPSIDFVGFTINLILTFILVLLIAWVYDKYGSSISNRKMFAKNLIMIALITMLIITIVKSSLALSLGLVGALSIVRFRTPIKEPEELSYLFFSIAVGLGLGAGQRMVTIAGCLFIILIIIIRIKKKTLHDQKGMHLSIITGEPKTGLMDAIVDVLQENTLEADLIRVDETDSEYQSDFIISFADFKQFNELKKALRKLDEKMHISLIDNQLL